MSCSDTLHHAETHAPTAEHRHVGGTAWSTPSVRLATLSLLSFAAGAAAQAAGAPDVVWWVPYLVCYVAGGWGPAREGLAALAERRLDVDLLMVVAAVGAAAIGQVFDGALLIVIFATSGALEDLATRRTESSVTSLLTLAPDRAVVVDADGTERTVDAATLAVGDDVLVRPGERVSADGRVTEGSSDVDQSSITGESVPATKTAGDDVFAGTLNGAGALRVRVTRDPSQTVVARIVDMVAEASATKATTQLFIEKVEQRYSVLVVVATLALLIVPLVVGADLQSTLLRAMTFMIVASPCALVLATMPPLLSTIANAGRHGVLVKSSVAIERLASTTRVVLDKTGTVTVGTPEVSAVVPVDGVTTELELLTLAAAAERNSEHPLGRAIVAAARRQNLRPPVAERFAAMPGVGVQADVGGHRVSVVKPAMHHDVDGVAALQSSGATVVVVTVDDTVAGYLGLTDEVRTGAGRAIRRLAGFTSAATVLLTGDNHTAAARVAREVGIGDVRAELLPEQKAATITSLQRAGERVLVVGDGVNDAPAMAAAHASVAMGRSGSDLSIETADAVTVRDDLDAIATVLALSRRARRVVVANLVIAGATIVALVTWDLVGHLPLPLGVAGHEGSTILVALNGLRLLTNRAWRKSTRSGAALR